MDASNGPCDDSREFVDSLSVQIKNVLGVLSARFDSILQMVESREAVLRTKLTSVLDGRPEVRPTTTSRNSRSRPSILAPLEDEPPITKANLNIFQGLSEGHSEKQVPLESFTAVMPSPGNEIQTGKSWDNTVTRKSGVRFSKSDEDENRWDTRISPFSSENDNNRDNRVSTVSSEVGEIKFETLPMWTRLSGFANNEKKRLSMQRMSTMMFDAGPVTSDLMTKRDDGRFSWLQDFLVHPNSRRRASWDSFSLCLLFFDLVMIPFQGCFDVPSTDFLEAMMWITRFFWSCDMLVAGITGHTESDGSIEMRPIRIWKRYLKTWFFVDALLVSLDWIEIVWSEESATAYARLGKASRGIRILRMLRLVRLIRIHPLFFRLVDERIRTERFTVTMDIMKFVLAILATAHFEACFWHGIGSMPRAHTWVKALEQNPNTAERYFLSLHWALSQFSGGMDEIFPHNLEERIYAVFTWMIGFLFAAVLVSSLTSEITRVQVMSNTTSQKMTILRRFLHDKDVSRALTLRLVRNARYTLEETQRNMKEKNVELLQLISEPLRVELHYEIFMPILARHPFFEMCSIECPCVMRKMCHRCTAVVTVFAGDVIFNAGETPNPPQVYFLMSGLLEYFLLCGRRIPVTEGMWVAEAVLWTLWTHRGGLRANIDSQLCLVGAAEFHGISHEFGQSAVDPRRYANEFVNLINKRQDNLSDLALPRQVIEEVVGAKRSNQFKKSDQVVPTTRLSDSWILPVPPNEMLMSISEVNDEMTVSKTC